MSEFKVPVVRIGAIEKHPNADTLSIVKVEGENVIIRTGDYQEGDLAVYVPVDGVVPPTVPGTEFLQDHRRIKAKRLRGIYSEGLLLPLKATIADLGASVVAPGDDLAAHLGITKHEDKVPDTWGTSTSAGSIEPRRGFWGNFFHWCFREQLKTEEKAPGDVNIPVYDIENGKKYAKLLIEGERVIITEKLHGTNFRCGFAGGKFYVGSRNRLLRNLVDREPLWRERFGEFVRTYILRRAKRAPIKQNLYWKVAQQYDLEQALRDADLDDGYVIYGEVFGEVQDLKYGAQPGQVWLRVFDIYDTVMGEWLDWDDVESFSDRLGLETVPVLYDGPYDGKHIGHHIEGDSVLAKHMREGMVIKPAETRVDDHFGRVILKYVSETYKLRKNGTELH